ncbi:hypothetical protein BD289DRAFT_213620 [Coniella lustricola]|uniref:Uncharacterized protein n=1 Tax=Coniella lustricola TaxID=2025994 RepID=A0A2T3ABN8_9PEZI|nr:hypothetical protein BD289DRAFT_213620 [Coniella lustricola]
MDPGKQDCWDLPVLVQHAAIVDGKKLEHVEDRPSLDVLPDFSQRGHSVDCEITASMIQAYVSMKGPVTNATDPFLRWIKERQITVPGAESSSVLKDLCDANNDEGEWTGPGPSSGTREQTNTVAKHECFNLETTDTSNQAALDTATENDEKRNQDWQQHVTNEVSDEEGNPANGLISPCTFARWAQGATRWDAADDGYSSAQKIRRIFDFPRERQRSPSPENCILNRPKYQFKELQTDGDHEQPATIWSSPPSLPQPYNNSKMNLGDLNLPISLEKPDATIAPAFDNSFPKDLLGYPRWVVDHIIDKYWGLDRTNAIIASKYRELEVLERHEERVCTVNKTYRHQIRQMKQENKKLDACLVLWHNTRDRRILEAVDRHIRALDARAEAKLAEVKAHYKENEDLLKKYRRLKAAQADFLAAFSKNTPDEVFKDFQASRNCEGVQDSCSFS